MYEEMLVECGKVPYSFDPMHAWSQNHNSVSVAIALLLRRCDLQADGHEGLSAKSTGDVVKAAVVSYWRNKDLRGPFVEKGNGRFTGNSGHAPELSKFITTFATAQRACGSNFVNRAYAETHEDLRLLYNGFIGPHTLQAYQCIPSVPLLMFKVIAINILQWAAAARADEVLHLKHEDLQFTEVGADCNVVASCLITENNSKSTTYITFRKGLHVSISYLSALLRWLLILRANGISTGPLFPEVRGNKLQCGTTISHRMYATTIASCGHAVGMSHNLTEHSARRGGFLQYYYVLGWDVFSIFRTFNWNSLKEMLNYLGILYESISYALAGSTAQGTSELLFQKRGCLLPGILS